MQKAVHKGREQCRSPGQSPHKESGILREAVDSRAGAE